MNATEADWLEGNDPATTRERWEQHWDAIEADRATPAPAARLAAAVAAYRANPSRAAMAELAAAQRAYHDQEKNR